MDNKAKKLEEVILGLGELIGKKNNFIDGLELSNEYLRKEKAELERRLKEQAARIEELEAMLFDMTQKKENENGTHVI